MIIGLSGLAGAGKDTVADLLVDHHGFAKLAFADPLKRICRDVFQFTERQLWGPSSARNAGDERYPRGDSFLTPRYALQQLGTEWGRDCFPSIWVDAGLRDAKKVMETACYRYESRRGLYLAPVTEWDSALAPKGVAISDVRFENEIAAVKLAGGKVIRIKRPSEGLEGEAAMHRSEAEQALVPDEAFDAVLVNDGSIAQLGATLARLLFDLRREPVIPPF